MLSTPLQSLLLLMDQRMMEFYDTDTWKDVTFVALPIFLSNPKYIIISDISNRYNLIPSLYRPLLGD